jgi:histidinol phosphatase-like enzyme
MKAAFVERSGVLHKPVEGRVALPDVQFYPFVERALALLSLKDYLIIVLHSQEVIQERRIAQVLGRKIQEKIKRLASARFEFASCYHDPEEECSCRMPKDGLIRIFERRSEVDLSQSIFFAGSVEGIEAAESAGIGTVMLMKTGKKGWRKPKESAVQRFANLEKAVKSLES